MTDSLAALPTRRKGPQNASKNDRLKQQGNHLMKEIVIASKKSQPNDALLRSVKMLFPDCTVRVLRTGNQLERTRSENSPPLIQARKEVERG